MHHPTYQSTGGGVPEVQLPTEHVDPDPFPPGGVVGIDGLVGCIGADVLPDGAAATPAVVLVRVFAALTEAEVWHISMLQYYHH
jgi:hypothetical protein